MTRAGAKDATVKPGTAVFVVRDRSATDNFRLVGPGVNKATSQAGKSTSTWRLTLKAGLYRYRSDATASLKGSFRVTAYRLSAGRLPERSAPEEPASPWR